MRVIAHLFENTIEGFTHTCDCLEFQKRSDIAHGFIDASELDFESYDRQYLTIAMSKPSPEG
jgi:hypothetical protein